MDGFIGRERELATLQRWLTKVEDGGRIGRPGRGILIRGRRRVGKSRLAEEFIRRADIPHLFFTASGQSKVQDLRSFATEAAHSTLPGAALFANENPGSWDEALELLAAAIPQDAPSVVVLDELPYLIANDPGVEGTLQKVFDRQFSRRPVLLLLIGSDLSIMEAINTYSRPFYQRATEMVVRPLGLADVADMVGLPAAESIDANLISGGLPLICEEWPSGASIWDYLESAVSDPTSALVVSGERALSAEFPPDAQARIVLSAMGSGPRSHASIGRAAGGVPRASLNRALQVLLEKRIIAAELPISTRPSRETRYQIADPHLRFWLFFIGPRLAEIERGRGDLVLERIRQSWTTWRGAAVEPLIRESVRRLDGLPEETRAIGGYWTRTNDVEIDLIGADREPVAKQITMVGSIKWLENRPFDVHDLSELIIHRSRLPGADTSTPLYAISRSGASVSEVTLIGPEELLDAWRR